MSLPANTLPSNDLTNGVNYLPVPHPTTETPAAGNDDADKAERDELLVQAQPAAAFSSRTDRLLTWVGRSSVCRGFNSDGLTSFVEY